MRPAEERSARVCARAAALERKRDRRILLASGGGSFSLLAVLLIAVRAAAVRAPGFGGGFAGASLLAESAGGYVLTAVLAFVLGAAAALLGMRYRPGAKQNRNEAPPETRREQTGDSGDDST